MGGRVGVSGGIHKGDVVFRGFGFDAHFFGPIKRSMTHPYPSADATEWLTDQGIKLLVVDAGMLGPSKNPFHEDHVLLLENDIPLIENLAHLDQVGKSRARCMRFPWPSRWLFACR